MKCVAEADCLAFRKDDENDDETPGAEGVCSMLQTGSSNRPFIDES
jgi:hypothetical protein